MSTMRIDITKVRRDGGTQSREELNQNTVDEYGASMIAGDSFPPVKVFYDGTWYWLADGFHRVAAALEIKATTIFADVIQGTQRDAVLDSVAANSKHGLRRTRDDMRRAIKTLLRDEEWSKWSDREIARKVNCDHKTVGSVRAELASSGEIPQIERTVERNGTIYQMIPATKPMITNSVGRGFEIGEVVRYSEKGTWEYNYGQIAAIDGEDVVLNFAIKNRHEANRRHETITISRLKLFPITQSGYQYWFCHALYEARVVLFSWKDHFIAFNAPMEMNGGGYNWLSSDGEMGNARRVHPAWLEYWSQHSTSYVVVKPEDITPEMLDIVGRAGRARGGQMVMPPQPQPEAVQPVVSAPAAPEKPVLPEWAYEGNTVQHMSGKQCLIERKYFTDRWMLRVEMIKPADGFADASVFEFGPLPNPTILQPMPDTTQKPIQVGDTVITRTGRTGEVIDANGLIKVQTASYTSNHDPSSLKIAPAPAATATPIFNDSQMKKLQTSLERMFTFLELGLIPDEGNLLNDLENIYQAQHTARSEYRKLLDPRTGELIGEKR